MARGGECFPRVTAGHFVRLIRSPGDVGALGWSRHAGRRPVDGCAGGTETTIRDVRLGFAPPCGASRFQRTWRRNLTTFLEHALTTGGVWGDAS